MIEAIDRALAKEYYKGYMAALLNNDLDTETTDGENEESYSEDHWRDWTPEATKAIPPMFHTPVPDWEV